MTDRAVVDDRLRKVGRWSLWLGGAAAVVCLACAFFRPDEVARAYLPAFLFAWGLSIGCLGLGLLYRLTGGRWGQAGAPFFEAGLRLMPATAVLFLPVALGLKRIYPWAASDVFAGFENVAHRSLYLSEGFYLARTVGYFVLWSLMAFAAARGWGGAGLSMVLLVVSVTWAVMDWVMALDPWFASSILGALVGMGVQASAMALVCLGVAAVPGQTVLPSGARRKTMTDLGNLLLAFVMLWTYMAFSQFLIIWSGNLPEEAAWYVRRSTGGWQWVVVLLALIGFAAPFAALLFRNVKRRPQRLAAVAVVVLFAEYIALYWHVEPEYSPERFRLNPFAIVTPIATGGLWLALLVRQLRRSDRLAVATDSQEGGPA